MHSLILVLFVSSNVRATLHRRLNSQLANSMKEPVRYQARRAHAGRKEPVRQQCDRARTVDRTRTPLRRSPRFLKPALLVDPPAPESEENGDRTSSEVVLASKREGSTHSGPPLRPVPPFADPQLQGNNDHPGSVETMLVDPAVGDEAPSQPPSPFLERGGHIQLDDNEVIPAQPSSVSSSIHEHSENNEDTLVEYDKIRSVKEFLDVTFEVTYVCRLCSAQYLVSQGGLCPDPSDPLPCTPDDLSSHLRTVHPTAWGRLQYY
ncbi:hypothetical protein C8R46DRAFT_1231292 [Mycena filopes]|nr:hypothetical protein C8R46DRAFT_1231292 [Mycena filopes]